MSSTLPGKVALVKIAGTPTLFTAAPATDSGDHKTWQITDLSKSVWDPTATITVKDGGVPTVEAYTINRLLGTVTFGTANAGRVITFDGTFLPLVTAARCHTFAFTITASQLDDTAFESNGWMERQPNIVDIQGTLNIRYQALSTYWSDAIINGTTLLIAFFPDRTTSRPFVVCWAKITKDGRDGEIEKLVEETVTFVGASDADLNVAA